MPSKASLCALLLACGTIASAQSLSSPGRVYGTSDTDIPTPMHSTKTASDPGAIQALINFVSMAKITGWTGMTETGTITFAGTAQESDPATLSMLGSEASRLDVQRTAGTDSTIYNGGFGVFESASGTRRSLSSDITTLGILTLPRLFSTGYPTAATLLTDQGNIAINGKTLHRITLDDPATDNTGNPWKTIDLYFDPITRQLVESVAFVHLSTADAALYTIETTYADYQQVGAATLPLLYTQSLNGNLQWTFQATNVSMAAPNSSLFNF